MVRRPDLVTYVVNLARRPDRRARMEELLRPALHPTFTSDWSGPFDGRDLTRDYLACTGYQLFQWEIESDNPWWGRPLKLGEVGCTLAHLACWRHAAEFHPGAPVMILEDDVVLAPRFLDELTDRLDHLGVARSTEFDLLYLGRYSLEPDRPYLPGIVIPGYSHCTFGYLLTHQAVHIILETRLDQAIVPIDEFLPAMYVNHPRLDLRARFRPRLRALAFEPPLVSQLPKSEAGSDTEDSEFIDWHEA